MPNPDGINQLDRFGSELPYGDVKRLEELKRAAPLAGGTMPGSNAPQNAQRKAVRGPSRPKEQQAQTQMPPPPTQVSPEVIARETWKALLDSDPILANDPIVQWYASNG